MLQDLLPEALAVAMSIQDEKHRTNVLNALAEKLPKNLLSEVLAVTRSIQDENYCAEALSALTAAQVIQVQKYCTFSGLNDLPTELWSEGCKAVIQNIDCGKTRNEFLNAMVMRLLEMPVNQLFPLWGNILDSLSFHTRPNFLQDIKALFPVIFALGGETATAEIACAIVDVGRWWK